MENQTNETHSTTDSQEVSTSQLESTSDGQYVYEDANSTSSQQDSQHDEVVNSVIMEVSGELMLGNYVPHKHQIGGSESSDLSDDDARRFGSGGVIAKYPESSTGMSDNDWNPYATESDTNQTPRSPTSSASDDRNKIGFISKATFNIVPSEKHKEYAVMISMRKDENIQDRNRPDRVNLSSIEEKQKQDKEKSTINNEKRTDFKSEIFNGLRHNEDSEELKGRNSKQSSQEEKSNADGTRLGPPNNARSNYLDHNKLEREPAEFGTPVTASTESFKSLQSDHSEYLSGRLSFERQGSDKCRRESGESPKSLQSDGTGGYRSGRQSTDSGRSDQGCHSEVDMSEGGSLSGRQSLESHKSFLLEKSRGCNYSQQSHKLSGRSTGNDRSDRLDLLSEDTALNFKSLIESEDAQRVTVEAGINAPRPFLDASQEKRQNAASGDSVSYVRYATRSEPSFLPVKSSQSPVRNVERYISVAERERLLLKNHDVGGYVSRSSLEPEDKISDSNNIERARTSCSATQIPRFSAEHSSSRSPCDVTMKRVAALVEETKRQTRKAVAIPRPDPSGSEERFPLHERLTWSKHDDLFKVLENSSGLSKVDSQNSKSKDSVTAKSMDSEEVSRVLWKYTYDDVEKTRKDGAPSKCSNDLELVSAAEPVENSDTTFSEGGEILRRYAVADKLNLKKNDDEPDDEKAKKVKVVLSETGLNSVTSAGNMKMFSANYVPRTIDYTRLQRDLEEIQDSLQNCPTPKANDSVYALRRQVLDSNSPSEDIDKSVNTTGTTGEGRESGVSDLGRKLFWDHGADLHYDHDYSGQFLATSSATDTLSSRFHGSEDTDKLVVRPDSAATDDTEYEGSQFDGLKTLTGSDITRSERLLEQVRKQRPENAMKDSVEDIIARYRNERQDLFARHQTSNDFNISNIAKSLEQTSKTKRPSTLTDPDLILPQKQRTDEKKLPGLAERVYKILTAEQDKKEETDDQEEKGMAKKVYKILSTERPQEQVNGILLATMAEEHEMAKKMAMAQVDNSSLDDSGLNESADSFLLDEQDVCKRLQWSQLSSPEKGNKSDFGMIKEVTSVPYSAFNNANSLLSTQLKKMSERNFDKSIELQTPYRQAVESCALYQVDREMNVDTNNVREAWMPARRLASKGSSSNTAQALSSERFYLTDKDQAADKRVSGSETIPRVHTYNNSETVPRVRTYSDPFEVSSTKLGSLERDIHSRSKSEEAANVSDLSQYSFTETLPQHNAAERNNITKSGDFRILPEVDAETLSTLAQHRTKEWSFECYTSVSDSSDPYHHSDNSDFSRGNNLSSQLFNKISDPENDLFDTSMPMAYKKEAKTLTNSESSDTTPSPGIATPNLKRTGDCRNAASPVKSMCAAYVHPKYERSSRSRVPKSALQKVEFQPTGVMSRSLLDYYTDKNYTQKVPISSEDVYELLCRSQIQEKKLAEMQSKLSFPPLITQSASTESSQSSFSFHNNVSHCDGAKELASQSGRDCTWRSISKIASSVESDTSSSRKGSRLRPYRPAGSRDVYYTESGDDTNDSGTTIESTHPGSDDAAPPYIPAQYLGSRKDGEEKHSRGIYGNREKDALSTIDENSVKGDKERALTSSTGSGRDSQKGNYDHPLDRHEVVVDSSSCMDQQDAVTLNIGYHNNQQMRPRFIESSRSLLEFHSSTADPNSKPDKYKGLEKLGFKTREEFQRDFEKREQELKELLSKGHTGHVPMPRHQSRDLSPPRHQSADIPQQRDSLGTSIRSDPGGMLEGSGSRWEYRDSEHNEFQLLIPEPLQPQENLRYSRSKSDSDLVTMSPTANQKYSSPMLPGTRFLELTSQHSPIFSHHDSITLQHLGHPEGLAEPLELPRVNIEKELQEPLPTKELPRIYDRRSLLSTEDFTIKPSRHLTKDLPSENIARLIEPSEFPVRPLEPGADPRSLNQKLASAVRPAQSFDPGVKTNIYRSADTIPVYDHDPVRVPSAPSLRSDIVMDAVELGADPRKMAAVRKTVSDATVRARSKSPLNLKQKEMEAELEKLNKHLSDQVSEIQEPKKPADEVFEDNFPPSKKAQVLREVLEQEYMENLPPNINDMWTRFKETKEQSMSDSSLNSTRLDALMGLLKNPTHHAVNSLINERTKLNEKKKIDENENLDKLKEENSLQLEKQKKKVEVKAAEERRLRRQEMRQRHGTSEGDSNGSYSEMLIENERKKANGDGDTRSNDKKKSSSEKRSKSPSKKSSNSVENDKYSKEWKKDEACLTDISTCAAQPTGAKHVDSMDTLFSIPEDASFEQTPSKAESDMKFRLKRRRHVIDPVMKKLHDKIKLQRTKIDKERRKELQRVEKLKKLEMLLNAKRKGRLSDKAISVELENVSSATSYSESSQAMSDVTVSVVSSSLESDASTHISDSSTLKESSIDSNIKLQVKKYPESFSGIKKHVVESMSTDSSDFSNIIVERIPENKSEKRTKDRKGHAKGKKVKVNENENNKNSKDNQNRDIFGVGLSEKDMQRQLEQYTAYLDPQRQNKLKQDASTMYPSPVRLNQPSNRRIKEVLMTSKAIQTSPSVRPTSPTHAYDEVPVAPVPYMSNISEIAPHRQPTSALSKSIQTSPGRTSSKSPLSRTLHKSSQVSMSSKSLATKKSPKSPTLSQRDMGPTIIQKRVHTPIHLPEDTMMLPKNSIFSPESDENTLPPTTIKEAEAWFVPLKSSKPWCQPIKERQAFSVRQEIWKPDSVSNSTWKNIMHNVSVRDMDDLNVSTDTKFALDPEGQPIQDDNDMTDSDDDFGKSKPLYKMSLQEAFENRNPVAISRLRQRQKRLHLAAEQRKMEAYLKLERDRLFQDERKLAPNPDAHPYSDNLYKPEKRVISKEEMKELTEKKYKKLPEVLEHQKLKKREEEYSLNRLKARLFNRKIQRKVLVKAEKWGR